MIKNLIINFKSNFEIKALFILVTFFYYLVPIIIIMIGQQSNFFSSQYLDFTKTEDLNFSFGFIILVLLNFLLFSSIFIFVVNIIYKLEKFDKKNFSKIVVFNLLIKILLICYT